MEDGSNHNRITGNGLRYSGDGFFIRGHHGEPSRDNFVARNDASYSPQQRFRGGIRLGQRF